METKDLNEKAFQYIIDCIDSECYEIKTVTEKEKIEFLLKTFLSEQGWNIKHYSGNVYKAFENYLTGSPSCFNIVFTNYDIIQLAKSWGSIPQNATEKQEDKIIDNYFNFITNKFFQLVKKHKIDIEEIKAHIELDKMLK